MYGLNRNLRELSGSQSFPLTGFIPNTFRSRIDFFRYNQLPSIKEEGNVNESDIELRNIPSCSQFLNSESYKKSGKNDKTTSNEKNTGKKLAGEGWTRSEELLGILPALVNVNCLMNVNIKQQEPIWSTTFGKRLINGKTAIPETISLPIMKKAKKDDKKLRQNQHWKSTNSSQSFFSYRHIQPGNEDKVVRTKKKKTKPVPGEKKARNIPRKKSEGQKSSETGLENNICKSETDSAETSLKNYLPSSELLLNSVPTPHMARNQNFLYHCVKKIMGGVTTNYNCEHCNEMFPNVDKLNSHKDKHEKEKEICVLCNKVFYKPKEFVQHLLTHESIDKFSCKECKKYFPNLKKYKTHFKAVHFKSSESPEMESKCNLESMKKWTTKYECKRCELELASEETFKVHKRNHIRMDLMGAYLLSNKKI